MSGTAIRVMDAVTGLHAQPLPPLDPLIPHDARRHRSPRPASTAPPFPTAFFFFTVVYIFYYQQAFLVATALFLV